jgi:DNA-binding NarL/FixJ family response regulator
MIGSLISNAKLPGFLDPPIRANAEAQARRQAVPKLMGLGLSVTQVAETLGLSVAEVEDSQGD